MIKLTFLASTAFLLSILFQPALAASPETLVETPYWADSLANAKLPPVIERVPRQYSIVSLEGSGRSLGKHGGELRLLMGKHKDIRMMMVYGYARLVGYTDTLTFVPDILERIEVDQNRRFTLHLRQSHKWSDGAPFTSEDFRYYWEDVANNKDLSPFGPPKELLVDGKPPKVEIVDQLTLRYSWSQPNPYFLPALAGARPLFIYRPAHYLKQFHGDYVDAKSLADRVSTAGTRNWAGLHHRKDHQYKFDNPDLPTLQPWRNTTPPPAERFVFERNPYYHRVDTGGRQLPYIDKVIVSIASPSLIPAKTGAGDSDLQARYLRFDNYTFLKAGEKRNNYAVRLWPKSIGSQVALFPNLNTKDNTWRKLLRDVRFRRALSLGINRHEVNQIIYFGLVIESNNTVLPQSPLFRPEYQTSWANFDLAEANRLLNEVGLTKRNDEGLRLLPNGKPAEIIVQSAGESTEETDVLELIHDSWLRLGLKLYTKPSQREVFRTRTFAGDTIMAVWSGISNGIASADMSPQDLAPTSQQQLQWPKWGEFYETGQKSGVAPDLEPVEQLLELNEQWRLATSTGEREKVWHQMLGIHRDQVYSIGVVCGVRQPVVVNNNLRNLPQEGIYSWEPGAYFGIYKPDTFWFSDTRVVNN